MKYFIAFICVFSFSFCEIAPGAAASFGARAVVQKNAQNLSNFDDFSEFEGEFEAHDLPDPLIAYNKMMTNVNDIIYRYAFTPVFVVYHTFMPAPIEKGISNFFDNLMFPIRFVNNILQFKFLNATDELFSFTLNTTFGVGGLFEVSDSVFGIKRHDEDFGQTLGHWGVGAGIPVVLPVIGQSNLRDIVGIGVDNFTNPLTYADMIRGKKAFHYGHLSYELPLLMMINEGAKEPRAYEILTRDAINLYVFMKNSYEQRRNAQIKE